MERGSLLVALVAAAAVWAPAEAGPLGLPVEAPLEAGAVWLELHSGRVRITVSREAAPTLRILDLAHGEDSDGFVLVEEREKWLEITQPHGDERTAPPLDVDLTVRPGTEVLLKGGGITVTVEGGAAAADKGAEAGDRGDHEDFTVELDRSRVLLRDVTSAGVEGRDSDVQVEGGAGRLRLAQVGGSTTVEDRRGRIEIAGEDPAYRLVRFEGYVEGRMEGGSLTVEDSVATLQLAGNDAQFLLDGWRGTGSIRGRYDEVELVRSGGDGERLTLDGEDFDVRAEEFDGELTAVLRSGNFVAQGLRGRVSLRLSEGAAAEIRGAKGGLRADLSGGARLVAEEVEPAIELDAKNSRVDLASVRSVRATLHRSELSADEIEGRVQITATASDLDLDLTESRTTSEIQLRGTSRATVDLRQPCVVNPEGGREARNRVDVSGCAIGGSRRPAGRRASGAPSVLRLSVGPGAQASVYGMP
ncbi:MAG: hypothetical protein D6718_10530 [Acidobacteria bacterium]|nr:MAG: hypothetical protein D6718_10530 [Acidobacteriota bacterium]